MARHKKVGRPKGLKFPNGYKKHRKGKESLSRGRPKQLKFAGKLNGLYMYSAKRKL